MKKLDLEIPIKVYSWKRTRGAEGKRFLERRLVEYYSALRALVFNQLRERGVSMPAFPDEDLRLSIWAAPVHATADLSNIVKAIEDALQERTVGQVRGPGVLWANDRQIRSYGQCDVIGRRGWAKPPLLKLKVEVL